MDTNGINSFEDFIKFCRSTCNDENNESQNDEEDSSEDCKTQNNSNDCDSCRFGSKNAEASESSRNACSDIPGGFQDINPQLFTIVTSILGTVIANNLPFNLQNAIGNWLELLGQSIITFNAQQQYFQGGPGRVYNPIYRNAANPFCSSSSDETQKNISVDKGTSSTTTSNSSKKNNNNSKSNKKTNTISDDEIKKLKCCISDLSKEIEELKNEIEKMKNNKM